MAIEVKPFLTPDLVEAMIRNGELNSDDMFEVVNGEIVWLAPALNRHGMICTLIIGELVPFARSIGATMADGQTGFWVGDRQRQLRSPDVALVSKERSDILREDGFNRGAPDLAVEVLSKAQFGAAYAHGKQAEYFAAGAKVVWLVDPANGSVREHFANETEYRIYRGDAEITLDAIAPGFHCPVSRFFEF